MRRGSGYARARRRSASTLTRPDVSHVRLHELKVLGISLKWAVGFSDATGTPSSSVDSLANLCLTTICSWITFEGYMNNFPFSFQQNSLGAVEHRHPGVGRAGVGPEGVT